MILQLLAFAVLVVISYFVFKTARDYGRNPALWTILTVGVGLFFQFILPFLIGLVLAIVWIASGTPPERLQVDLQTPLILIGFVSLGLSFVGMFLILKYVSRIPDESPNAEIPPPPPTFEG